ncbi:MAG: HAD hydrolase-like protein [bacterium]
MGKNKAIAFDLDGTLFNSLSVSVYALEEGFREFKSKTGYKGRIPTWQETRKYIGLPSYEFYSLLLAKDFRDRWSLLHESVQKAEKRHLAKGQGHVFPGVHEVLGKLKADGWALGCLSNASSGYFNAIMDECHLRNYFEKFRWLGQDYLTDKSMVLKEWVREWDADETLFYAGDRANDIEAAHNAGLEGVGVGHGYGGRDELFNAEAIIDAFSDFMFVLTSNDRLVWRIADTLAGLYGEERQNVIENDKKIDETIFNGVILELKRRGMLNESANVKNISELKSGMKK